MKKHMTKLLALGLMGMTAFSFAPTVSSLTTGVAVEEGVQETEAAASATLNVGQTTLSGAYPKVNIKNADSYKFLGYRYSGETGFVYAVFAKTSETSAANEKAGVGINPSNEDSKGTTPVAVIVDYKEKSGASLKGSVTTSIAVGTGSGSGTSGVQSWLYQNEDDAINQLPTPNTNSYYYNSNTTIPIVGVELTNNSEVETVDASSNTAAVAIEISNCSNLKSVYGSSAKSGWENELDRGTTVTKAARLTTLSVTSCSKLETLIAGTKSSANKKFDTSQNTVAAALASLNISGDTALKTLEINTGDIKTKVTGTGMTEADTTWNFTGYTNLESLTIDNTKVATLNASGLTNLADLKVNKRGTDYSSASLALTSVNLSGDTKLGTAKDFGGLNLLQATKLEELNVSGCENLVSSDSITFSDSGATAGTIGVKADGLKTLNMSAMKAKKVTIPNGYSKLATLDLSNNYLTSINTTSVSVNTAINVAGNYLVQTETTNSKATISGTQNDPILTVSAPNAAANTIKIGGSLVLAGYKTTNTLTTALKTTDGATTLVSDGLTMAWTLDSSMSDTSISASGTSPVLATGSTAGTGVISAKIGTGSYAYNTTLDLTVMEDVASAAIVTFNLEGGNIKGVTADQQFIQTKGATFSTADYTPVKTGYVFKGWGTTQRSDVIAVEPGAEATVNADTTYYAKWAKETYTLTPSAGSTESTIASTIPVNGEVNFTPTTTAASDSSALDEKYTATSLNPAAVSASVSADGKTVTLKGLAVTTSPVTVTIKGVTSGATATITATVVEGEFLVAATPESLEIEPGATGTTTITTTLNGEETTENYTVVSSDETIVTATIDGNVITATAGETEGEATLTVTGDKSGEAKAITIPVKVAVAQEPVAEEISINGAAVTLDTTSAKYTGKQITPAVTSVTVDGATVPADAYTVSYGDNKNAGNGTVTVTANAGSGYTGSVTTTFKITKAAQTITVKGKTTKKVAAKKLKKKNVKFKIKATAKGSVSFSSSNKKVKVSKAGKVTLKKGLKKGTYKITIKAAATTNYKAATKTYKVVVK